MASRRCFPPRRVIGDDVNNNPRWEEQDMPYLSCNQRQAEGGEGDVDDGGDDEHVGGCVRGLCLADTGNGRSWWRSRRGGDNDDKVKEGGSHPTPPRKMAVRKLAERLHSAGCDRRQAEEGESDADNGGNN